MGRSSFIIPGELTDLNSYVYAERSNRFKGAKIKAAETQRVAGELMVQRVKKLKEPIVELVCYWYTKDNRKDADNVSFALKFIMDGMVQAGMIPNDSRKFTGSIVHHFDVDKRNPRVEIYIT